MFFIDRIVMQFVLLDTRPTKSVVAIVDIKQLRLLSESSSELNEEEIGQETLFPGGEYEEDETHKKPDDSTKAPGEVFYETMASDRDQPVGGGAAERLKLSTNLVKSSLKSTDDLRSPVVVKTPASTARSVIFT
jgi:hypothetical protein